MLRRYARRFSRSRTILLWMWGCSRRASSRRKSGCFVFDMDSTLIQGETIDELAKMAGVGDQVVAITASAMRGEIRVSGEFPATGGVAERAAGGAVCSR